MNIPYEILTLKDEVEQLKKRIAEFEEFLVLKVPSAAHEMRKGPGRPRKDVTDG